MIRIQISDDAIADLNDGFIFYESQGFGLGDYFLSNLRGDIEGLKVTAGMHRVAYNDYHCVLSRVFPYAIFYTLKGDQATIWAVVDCRREPAWIETHLGDTGPEG